MPRGCGAIAHRTLGYRGSDAIEAGREVEDQTAAEGHAPEDDPLPADTGQRAGEVGGGGEIRAKLGDFCNLPGLAAALPEVAEIEDQDVVAGGGESLSESGKPEFLQRSDAGRH